MCRQVLTASELDLPGNRRLATNHFRPGSYVIPGHSIAHWDKQNAERNWVGDGDPSINYLIDDGSVRRFGGDTIWSDQYGFTNIVGFTRTIGLYEGSLQPIELLRNQ